MRTGDITTLRNAIYPISKSGIFTLKSNNLILYLYISHERYFLSILLGLEVRFSIKIRDEYSFRIFRFAL